MFHFIAVGLSAGNLLCAILAMALNWLQSDAGGVNMWAYKAPYGNMPAWISATRAFLVLSFITAVFAFGASGAAFVKKAPWVAPAACHAATWVFALIAFSVYASNTGDVASLSAVNYGAGFAFEVIVFILGLFGMFAAALAHRDAENECHGDGNYGAGNAPPSNGAPSKV
uniref:Uncharacterized protein n=1 Tax=Mucochytrium quahogii TaxID=96639 RepID=A0A7S2RML2_9STRA|mmetsp:Transcript_14303/g.23340  ORF Transcript_14303/g.23340 Transcript_14303/m.23340 type:complete len:170 (-) Transcript_14303:87-596(-)|eukprot:CAMPEP_0203749836 /NCGR_PEP_ID=MMETSP0098-20131031/4239_1 /ASSEMBLY_ACC=CAM_ASM_000208 /TAXON_ID=96639 /ORGANISM=" , Strain NY0313808BC1" /LENGTH=169 /DNA_ID=CAMNT_0050638953 /DNA_START=64 /DNA_END=573 /DNA_ORIENTATION=+